MSFPEIRVATSADAPAMLEIYSSIVTETAASFEVAPPSIKDFTQRVQQVLACWPWIVCEADSEIVGYAYADSHRSREAYRWSVETTVYVSESLRGRRVGYCLYQVLFELLAEQGAVSAFAGVTLPNDASVSLHRSSGFRSIGVFPAVGYKHGQWRDVSWWYRPIREGDMGRPDAPVRFADLNLTGESTYREALRFTTGGKLERDFNDSRIR